MINIFCLRAFPESPRRMQDALKSLRTVPFRSPTPLLNTGFAARYPAHLWHFKFPPTALRAKFLASGKRFFPNFFLHTLQLYKWGCSAVRPSFVHFLHNILPLPFLYSLIWLSVYWDTSVISDVHAPHKYVSLLRFLAARSAIHVGHRPSCFFLWMSFSQLFRILGHWSWNSKCLPVGGLPLSQINN